MTQQDIINTVDPIASRYGVPTFIWETVAEVESGMNPRQVGDNGTSFGLFQLHRGGQLNNLTPAQAADPATNANAAMPAIAKAWKDLSGGIGGPAYANGTQYSGTKNWWYLFAVESGHPGADTALATAEADKLQKEATQLAKTPLPKAGTANTNVATRQTPDTTTPASGCSLTNPGACIQDYINGAVVQPVQKAAPRIGLFLLALVLIVVGLWTIAQ